jgi:hypothetical protein
VVTLVLPEQRRDVSRLMSVAGIRPRTAQVRPGDAELTRVTGAREPSGVPVTIVAPAPAPAARAGSPRGRRAAGNGGRIAADSGRAAGGRQLAEVADSTPRPAHRPSGRRRRPQRPRTA